MAKKEPHPLRKFIEEEKVSPSELSDILMVSLSTVYSWLRGDTMPTTGNMRNIARKMNINASLLIHRWRKWETQQINQSFVQEIQTKSTGVKVKTSSILSEEKEETSNANKKGQ